MPHHGDAGTQNHLDSGAHLASSFEFHAVGARFLHDAHGVALRFHGIALISAEWHIHNDHRTLDGTNHGAAVNNHVIDGDGDSGGIALHDIGSTVTHQDDVDACLIHQCCHREIIGSNHGDFLACHPHVGDALGRDFAGVGNGIC